MRALVLAIVTFAAGILFGSRFEVQQVMSDVRRALVLGPRFSKCLDVYAGYPLSPVYQIDDIEPAKIPFPGVTHITLHGYRQHGMRNMDVMMQTIAPGGATPVHEHNCNEVFYVLKGTVSATLRGKDGSLHDVRVPSNGTFNVFPNVRHQLRNGGPDDLQILVITDNPPFLPHFFDSWNATKPFASPSPMFWDVECPQGLPDSLKHLAAPGKGGAGSTAEL